MVSRWFKTTAFGNSLSFFVNMWNHCWWRWDAFCGGRTTLDTGTAARICYYTWISGDILLSNKQTRLNQKYLLFHGSHREIHPTCLTSLLKWQLESELPPPHAFCFCPVSTHNLAAKKATVKTCDRSASHQIMLWIFIVPRPKACLWCLSVSRKSAATERSAPTKSRTNVGFVVETTPTAALSKEPSPKHQRKLVRTHWNQH